MYLYIPLDCRNLFISSMCEFNETFFHPNILSSHRKLLHIYMLMLLYKQYQSYMFFILIKKTHMNVTQMLGILHLPAVSLSINRF